MSWPDVSVAWAHILMVAFAFDDVLSLVSRLSGWEEGVGQGLAPRPNVDIITALDKRTGDRDV